MSSQEPKVLSGIRPRQIYLLGLRASGKSSTGQILAGHLGGVFVDLDDITPGVLGERTAADALLRHGEPAFRHAERLALDDPRVLAASVVALGGGTPTHTPSRDELRRRAMSDAGAGSASLIYLRASAETLHARLATTDLATRPGLLFGNPLAEIDALWALRDPIYQALATRVIQIDAMTPDQVAVVLSCSS